MTTVHAYTTDQSLLDQGHASRSGKADLRRMRAAAVSIVPTSTGASRAVGEVLPQLAGRLEGIALRVPVPVGSIVDLVAVLDRDVTTDEVNDAFDVASHDKSYRDVLRYTDRALVSHDIVGNPASCVFSARDTMASAESRQGLGLVRQRMGICEPSCRSRDPHGRRRWWPVSAFHERPIFRTSGRWPTRSERLPMLTGRAGGLQRQ